MNRKERYDTCKHKVSGGIPQCFVRGVSCKCEKEKGRGKTFVIADPHFGHKGVCHFTNYNGSKLRPFTTPEEMDEALVANWNAVVRDEDRVYVAGDVVINRKCLPTIGRCLGRKVLVKGNHDIFKLSDYTPYFDDIRAYVVGNGYIITHIPIHPDCLISRFGLNIHGHLHGNNIRLPTGELDLRYFCVSVEQINFTPLDLNWIIEHKVKPLKETIETKC